MKEKVLRFEKSKQMDQLREKAFEALIKDLESSDSDSDSTDSDSETNSSSSSETDDNEENTKETRIIRIIESPTSKNSSSISNQESQACLPSSPILNEEIEVHANLESSRLNISEDSDELEISVPNMSPEELMCSRKF